jgi:hypothetical protein
MPDQITRIAFAPVEDVRVLFLRLLDFIPERKRAALAARLADALQARGLLSGGLQPHYTAVQVGQLLSRGPEWVAARVKAGDFGPCSRDDGGWLIPASGVNAYLARRVFVPTPAEVAA